MIVPWPRMLGAFLFAGTIVYPYTHLIRYPIWPDRRPRPEKTVIIVGATDNLGKASTFQFAKRQCRVIMATDDMNECRIFRREMVIETKNKSLACRYLNLANIESINKFADEIIENEPHIDILVNRTTLRDACGEQITEYGVEKHFLVNFLAIYLLTLRLLPKLEEAAAQQRDSRIVNIVFKPKKYWRLDLDDINFEKRTYTDKKALAQSDLALAYFTIVLDKFLREKKSRILVFTQAIDVKRVSDSFINKHEGMKRDLINLYQYFYYNPLAVMSSSARFGLDEKLGLEDSGKLYKYFMLSYGRNKGWGLAGDDETKAKLVWNYAANYLVKAPEPTPKVKNSSETPVIHGTDSRGHDKTSGIKKST